MAKKFPASPHSIRVPDPRWAAARSRAAREGVRISYVINEFLEGYARNQIDMPRVTTSYTLSDAKKSGTQ